MQINFKKGLYTKVRVNKSRVVNIIRYNGDIPRQKWVYNCLEQHTISAMRISCKHPLYLKEPSRDYLFGK